MSDDIPDRVARLERQTAGMITMKAEDYNALITRIYAVEQRLCGVEKQVTFDTSLDELYRRQQFIERMLKKIGIALLGRRKTPSSPPAPSTSPAPGQPG